MLFSFNRIITNIHYLKLPNNIFWTYCIGWFSLIVLETYLLSKQKLLLNNDFLLILQLTISSNLQTHLNSAKRAYSTSKLSTNI